MTAVKTLVSRLWLAMAAAYVALLPSFYLVFNAANRFSLFWTRAKHAAILASVAILGLCYFLAYLLVYRVFRVRGLPKVTADSMFVLCLWIVAVRTVVALVDRSGAGGAWFAVLVDTNWAKLVYYLIVPCILIVRHRSLMRRAVIGAFLIVSPVLLLLCVLPATYETFDINDNPLPSAMVDEYRKSGDQTSNSGVYVFVFDEWSYARTFPDGTVWGEMTNLMAVMDTATVWQNAYSPGATTAVSIPRMLFQNDHGFRTMTSCQIWDFVLSRKGRDGACIFDAFPNTWFKTAIGFWHDYPHLLRDKTSFSATAGGSLTGALPSFGEDIQNMLSGQLAWLRWLGIRPPSADCDAGSDVWLHTHEQIHSKAISIIARIDAPTFGFFHYCLPHYPYAWNRNGRKNVAANVTEHTLANYLDNLRYLDTVIGEIVQELREVGKFDSSLLVFTSDHSWRFDPELTQKVVSPFDKALREHEVESRLDHSLKHVPPIVKMPYQNESKTVETVTSLMDLLTIIRQSTNENDHGMKPL